MAEREREIAQQHLQRAEHAEQRLQERETLIERERAASHDQLERARDVDPDDVVGR